MRYCISHGWKKSTDGVRSSANTRTHGRSDPNADPGANAFANTHADTSADSNAVSVARSDTTSDTTAEHGTYTTAGAGSWLHHCYHRHVPQH